MLYTLKDAGYEAYLVGGGVRDLLLGRIPKDFDVATNARPEEIKDLFRSCRLIGRRFRLAHVRIGRDIIEVATFRAGTPDPEDDVEEEPEETPDRVTVDGRILRDNVYGTFEEDAWRRDFTVNCLYYDIRDFSVVDFADGVKDIESRTMRVIGDPVTRLREDPVRMLRAIRFAAKLDFRIDKDTGLAISECAPLLEDIPPARLYDEVLKLFTAGAAVPTYELLRRYDLFRYLFPETDSLLDDDEAESDCRLVEKALANTDARVAEDKPVTPSFLFAALLWPPLRHDAVAFEAQGQSPANAIEAAGGDVLERQVEHVSFPRRFSTATREIWSLQPRLQTHRGKRAPALLSRPRFRAAYDFLVLRAEAGEPVDKEAEFWTKLQATEGEDRERLLEGGTPAPSSGNKRRRRRRRRRREPRAEASSG